MFHSTCFAARCSAAAIASGMLAASGMSLTIIGGSIDRPENVWFGTFRSGTAVAVGETTFITAGHVGGGMGNTVIMHGESYTVTARSVIGDDVALISVNRSVAGYHEIADSVSAGADVVIAGTGRRSDVSGAAWGGRDDALGTNVLTSVGPYLAFTFDQGIAGEAGFTTGDSGAGVFIENEHGDLELVGIGRSIFGTPGETNYGDLSIATTVTSFSDNIEQLGAAVPGAPTGALAMLGVAALARRRRRYSPGM